MSKDTHSAPHHRLPQAAPRVGFVSLGCPKALVDSEQILTQLRAEGYAIAPTYDGADLVVVNTCGFIDAAVAESLDAIGEALSENGKVIVTGCLGAKEGGDFIRAAHPRGARGHGAARDGRSDGGGARAPAEAARSVRRSRAAAGHQAHADGTTRISRSAKAATIAARSASFPSMRGDLVSRPIGEVLAEAEHLLQAGVRELLVDLAGHERLRRRRALPHRLLARPPAQDANDRARHRARRARPRARRVGAPALRLSLSARRRRHFADDRRPGTGRTASVSRRAVPAREPAHPQADEASRERRRARCARIEAWRAARPDLTIRSTFIVGFPGETEREFEELLAVPRRGAARSRRLLRLFAGRRRDGECAARPRSRRRQGGAARALHGGAGQDQRAHASRAASARR